MKSVIKNGNTQTVIANHSLSFSYSESIDDVKTEVMELLIVTMSYAEDVISGSSSENRKGVFKEFFFPYKNDFRIINMNTEKINVGVHLINENLSVKQYRADKRYEIIQQRLSILKTQLIPELERKQKKKMRKNILILIAAVIFHVLFYGWLFFN